MSEDRVWRSLHVYRYGEQDAFLVDGVAPVIDGLRESGALADFFFLRYWQGGHHVRVRLLLDRAQADAAVEEATGKLAAHLAGSPVHVDFDADEFAEAAQPMMAAMEGERVQRLQPPTRSWNTPTSPSTPSTAARAGWPWRSGTSAAAARSCSTRSAGPAARPASGSAPGSR
ncbi:lantibiotic dehydratase C-terminal domain-containing protein [Actinokineospora soli]|uniref:Lantibiotic dehydratase C-terminal domain-containing protein n=1 Tax=Actinokineospora soli TaxID=1048753 RepID=A0ABW2TPX9_9PSEU